MARSARALHPCTIHMQRYASSSPTTAAPGISRAPPTDAGLEALLDELKQVPAAAFEAFDTSSLMISPDSMRVRDDNPGQPTDYRGALRSFPVLWHAMNASRTFSKRPGGRNP